MDLPGDDLRLAFRRIRHQPAFTALVVLTLAAGLGANITVLTLIDGLLVQSLPVERPRELYRLGDDTDCCVNSGLQDNYSLFSYRLFEHLRASLPEVDLAGFQANTLPVAIRRSGARTADPFPGQFVTSNYFRVFGVRAAVGRVLEPADDRPAAPPVVVLSHRAWAHYGFDPSLVGSVVIVNGTPMTIAGVAPIDFFGDTIRPNPPAVWIPLGQEPVLHAGNPLTERADQNWLYAIGRFSRDTVAEDVETRATAALQQWLSVQPFITDRDRARLGQQHVAVTPAGGGVPIMQGQFQRSLTTLLAASGLLLLLATANLANLLVARADRGQAAIRAALGASTWRQVRQSLTEGVLLALAGGAAGMVAATFATRALVTLAFPTEAVVPVSLTPSLQVLAAASVLAVLTGTLFTGLPAWAMARTAPLEALSGAGRGAQGRTLVPRRSLVVVQVGVCFVLLTSAGLLAGSLLNLERQPLGFDPAHRIVLFVDPPARDARPDRLARLYEQLREGLGRLAGIRGVSYALYSPMEGNNWSSRISIEGRAEDPARPDSSSWNRIGPDYFRTLATRVVRGRGIEERDLSGARRVAVVNEAFVRRFLDDADPIGRRVGIGDVTHSGDFEIAGVTEDVKYTNASQPVRPMLFLPAFQAAEYTDESARSVQARSMLLRAVVLHVAPGAGTLEPALRRVVAEVDPEMTVLRIVPMVRQVGANFRTERLLARLTSVYGTMALILASLGLYAVTAFGVVQRTREIGVRMALGARRSHILRSVVGAPFVETLVGLALGSPVAYLTGRALESQLYGLDSRHPVVWAGAVLCLTATTAVAAALPARRAMSLDAARALRTE